MNGWPMRSRGIELGEESFERNGLGLWVPKRERRVFEYPLCIDLFSGAGGFSLGFHQAGFQPIAACDNDEASAMTYLVNLGQQPVDLRFTDDSYREKLERAIERNWKHGRKSLASPELQEQGVDQVGAEYKGSLETIPSVAGSGYLSHYGEPLGHERGECATHIGSDDDPTERTDEEVRSAREWFCDSYHKRPEHPNGCRLFWFGDIRELSGSDFLDPLGLTGDDISCVVGGPPCQGFSHSGMRNVHDPRNSLVFEFARVVCEIHPQAFCMEEVPGILSMVTPDGENVIDALLRVFETGGMGEREALKRGLLASAGLDVKTPGMALRGRPGSEEKVEFDETLQEPLFE